MFEFIIASLLGLSIILFGAIILYFQITGMKEFDE